MTNVNSSYNGIILPDYESGKQIVEYLNSLTGNIPQQ